MRYWWVQVDIHIFWNVATSRVGTQHPKQSQLPLMGNPGSATVTGEDITGYGVFVQSWYLYKFSQCQCNNWYVLSIPIPLWKSHKLQLALNSQLFFIQHYKISLVKVLLISGIWCKCHKAFIDTIIHHYWQRCARNTLIWIILLEIVLQVYHNFKSELNHFK